MPPLSVIAAPTLVPPREKLTDFPLAGPDADDNVACSDVVPPKTPDAAATVNIVVSGPTCQSTAWCSGDEPAARSLYPTTWPASFIPVAALESPPSVARSTIPESAVQMNACWLTLPAMALAPDAVPVRFTDVAALDSPPSVPRSTMLPGVQMNPC